MRVETARVETVRVRVTRDGAVLFGERRGVQSLDSVRVPLSHTDAGVRRLDLSFNWVGSLAGVARFSNLVLLNISHNQIKDIDPLCALEHLREANLQSNLVRDVLVVRTAVAEGKLSSLRVLNLEENPVTDDDSLDYLARRLHVTVSYYPFLYKNYPSHPLILQHPIETVPRSAVAKIYQRFGVSQEDPALDSYVRL